MILKICKWFIIINSKYEKNSLFGMSIHILNCWFVISVCILSLSILTSCTLPGRIPAQTAIGQIVSTVHFMGSRTPYPTYTGYPTQIPYPSYTPKPSPQGIWFETDTSVQEMYMENAPYPTQTAYPTQRAYTEDDMKHKIVMLPGIWARNLSEYGHCEDDFSVKIGSKTPYFAFAVGGEASKKQFLILNISFYNSSDHTLHIDPQQFQVFGNLNGKEVVYDSHIPAGQAASNRWGMDFIGSRGVPPGLEIGSYLAFDVDYHAVNWRLVYHSDSSEPSDCNFSIEIPQPEFAIKYYETLMSTSGK